MASRITSMCRNLNNEMWLGRLFKYYVSYVVLSQEEIHLICPRKKVYGTPMVHTIANNMFVDIPEKRMSLKSRDMFSTRLILWLIMEMQNTI